MKAILQVSLWGVLAVMMGCALVTPNETLYLRSALDRATQEEVKQRLGPPWRTTVTPAGESVWVYEVREQDPGCCWTSRGLWCDEYVLTFDNRAVLRRWTHESQFHGGEIMPTYCVTGRFRSESSTRRAEDSRPVILKRHGE